MYQNISSFQRIPQQEDIQLNELHPDQQLPLQDKIKKIISFILLCILVIGGIVLLVLFFKLNRQEPVKQLVPVDRNRTQQAYIKKLIEDNNIAAIHTVFKVRQNIPYIREWLIYHINIGFNKIYMYDNSKSKDSLKRNPFSSTGKNINKYGVNFDQVIPKTQQQIETQWRSIKQEFKQHIVPILWEPKDQEGIIRYQWPKSYLDYIKKYGKQHLYTAFIDVDEFIFSAKNLDLKQTLKELHKTQYTQFRLFQQKFTDRFCSEGRKATQIYDSIKSNLNNTAPKWIIQNQYAEQKQPFNMHSLKTVKGKTKELKEKQWRFNHYNTNKKGQEFMIRVLKHQIFVKEKDQSMKRYKQLIDSKCKNKCADKDFAIKYVDQQDKQSICFSKNIKLLSEKQYPRYYSPILSKFTKMNKINII